ncbi:MAG: hypothetical protein HZA78_03870 [Candidatus Schekmanbacteria bacterium]|nr:hypothetical protein [Candidatus Schekmanbacteria bacterium]
MKVKVGAKEVDFDLGREHIEKILAKSGIEINKIVNNQDVFDKACTAVYKCIPIPLRWAVGEARVVKAMSKIREQINTVTCQSENNKREA